MSTPFLRLGEFAHNPAIEIFNPYVALQDWTGSPGIRLHSLVDSSPWQYTDLILPWVFACHTALLT
jgi:hypothetical protein